MKNMLKANVVMLSVGEEMYPQDYLDNVINTLKAQVAKMDCNLMATYKIMNSQDAEEVAEALEGKKVDAFIVNFVSWHITINVMHVLKNFRETPLLVWGIGGTTDKTGKLHSPAAAAGVTGIMPVLKELGFKTKVILTKPDSDHEYEKVADYLHSLSCAKTIRAARIGLVGYADKARVVVSVILNSTCESRKSVLSGAGVRGYGRDVGPARFGNHLCRLGCVLNARYLDVRAERGEKGRALAYSLLVREYLLDL